MDLLKELGLNEIKDPAIRKSKLEELQFEYLERYETASDDNRKAELEAMIHSIGIEIDKTEEIITSLKSSIIEDDKKVRSERLEAADADKASNLSDFKQQEAIQENNLKDFRPTNNGTQQEEEYSIHINKKVILIVIGIIAIIAVSIFIFGNKNDASNKMPEQNNGESTSNNAESGRELLSEPQAVYKDDNYEISLSKIVTVNEQIEFDYSIKNNSDKEVDFFIDEMVIDGNQIGVYSGNPLHSGSTMTQPVFLNPSDIGEGNTHTIKLYCSTNDSEDNTEEIETESFTCSFSY